MDVGALAFQVEAEIPNGRAEARVNFSIFQLQPRLIAALDAIAIADAIPIELNVTFHARPLEKRLSLTHQALVQVPLSRQPHPLRSDIQAMIAKGWHCLHIEN